MGGHLLNVLPCVFGIGEALSLGNPSRRGYNEPFTKCGWVGDPVWSGCQDRVQLGVSLTEMNGAIKLMAARGAPPSQTAAGNAPKGKGGFAYEKRSDEPPQVYGR